MHELLSFLDEDEVSTIKELAVLSNLDVDEFINRHYAWFSQPTKPGLYYLLIGIKPEYRNTIYVPIQEEHIVAYTDDIISKNYENWYSEFKVNIPTFAHYLYGHIPHYPIKDPKRLPDEVYDKLTKLLDPSKSTLGYKGVDDHIKSAIAKLVDDCIQALRHPYRDAAQL
jgi:hypothetical protein